MENKMKECAKCKNKYNREDFTKDSNRKDNLNPYCKSCCAESHKKYYEKNKEKLNEYTRKWQREHPEKVNKNQRERGRKTNYAAEKTPEQRAIRGIKRETRRLYPLGKEKCKYCNDIAIEHHHITKPITIKDFEYVCHECHVKAERQLQGRIS